MPLSPGDRLGPYEILSLIGVGGMGEVYKARDTRLDRIVALKVSKAEFTERFKQEARLVAQLNHRNICTLHDVGPNFLVMELVDGVPLKGPLPVEKAVEYAGQILSALDHAHSKAITHRDLKPANIMVTKEGIKLLDFGLAKKTAPPKHDDTTRTALTVDGQITGTLQYMAPEQLQGKDADARSDLFAFGCVLYEMLSGTRAFDGSSAASVIAAVLERQPEPLKTTPPLDRVICRCLAKGPDDRFQTARDLKAALLWSLETTTPAPPLGNAATSRVRLLSAAAALFALIAAAAILYAFRATNAPAPETRLDIVTPPTNNPASFALSPDGRKIAFVATIDGASRLWVRSLDSTSAQVLPGTEGARSPFWSPDGRSLGFFADFKLKRIDLGGGAPQTVVAVSNEITAQGTWSDEGVILYAGSTNGPLFRVPASGGRAVAVTKLLNGQNGHRSPRFLPGGRQFLFYTNGAESAIWLGSLDGGETRRITAVGSGADSPAEYLVSGWLVQVRANALVAQRLDTGHGQLSGEPITLAQGAGLDQTALAGSFSVSRSGLIAWRSGGGGRRQLIWFNHSGQDIGSLGGPDNFNLFFPELSPDGTRVAITRGISGARDIWMQDGTRTSRFTFRPEEDRLYEIWSPDGARVVFASSRQGVNNLYQKPANGSGSEEALLQSTENKYPASWSPDGRFILYDSSQNNGDLMVLPLNGERKPFPFLSTPFNEMQGTFSPDGEWVAYQSNESGRFEIYVRPFPGPAGQWQISTGGGTSPRWRADGKELYYLAPDNKLMAAAIVVQGATFTPGTPVALFQTHIVQSFRRQNYDVARDGRFLIDTELQDSATEPIHLLLNWHPPAK
jgi:Tol biopolymer transport system component/predicted Ser/Thr protein kinase